MKKIILASGSLRRRELLSQIGLEYKVIVSNADENTSIAEPREMVCTLSDMKAQEVWNQLSEEEKRCSIVIGADTVVSDGVSILGKPKNEADAFAMIKRLQGKIHSVFTGVTFIAAQRQGEGEATDNETAIFNDTKKDSFSFYEETKVRVYPMSDEEIRRYIATGESMDKAGAYGIQGAFAAYVAGIEGDYNNVVGLPVARVYQELRKGGYLDDEINCQ